MPEALLAAVLIYTLSRLAFGYFSLASMLAAVALPAATLWMPKWISKWFDWNAQWGWDGALPIICFAFLAAGMVVARHNQNIGRLIAGTEPKSRVADRKDADADETVPNGDR